MQSIKKIEDYLLEKKIGEGQFGTVYKAKNIKTNNYFAIKVISKTLFENNKLMRKQLKRETVIMSAARHENLMYLHRSFETGRNYYLVLDYCNGGDLENFISEHKIKYFSELEAIRIISQIMQGFQELRKRNVMHRDLKLENIFISGSKVILGDFGAAKVVKEMTSTTVGTPLNMAPEVMAGEDYNNKSDLWSIGIMFYQLLIGKPPFFALSIGQLKQKALKNSGENLDFKKKTHFCNEVKNLLKSLLEPNPEKRISWKDFFNHKIFSKEHSNCCQKIIESSNSSLLDKFAIKEHSLNSSKKSLKTKLIKAKLTIKDNSNNLTAANSPVSNEINPANFHKKVQSRTDQGINQLFNNSDNSLNSPQKTSIDNESFNLLKNQKKTYGSERIKVRDNFSYSKR
jgi:serine/threonine protein kinase